MKANNTSNHLSDELLIGFIEGRVDVTQGKESFSHIKSCDKCFLKYSSLRASYQEMDNIDLEVTPDSLVERANREYHLVEPKRVLTTISEKFKGTLKIGYENLTHILRPRVVTYAVITTFILLIIFVPILFQKEDIIGKEDVRKILENYINRTNNTALLSSDESLGIKVYLSNDTLRITQPFRFNRTLEIISNNGSVLYRSNFSDLTNDFLLNNFILNEPSIVTIVSMDTIIYKNPISKLPSKLSQQLH